MANQMHNEDFFVGNDFIDYAIIANPKLEQPRQVARQRFRLHILEILCEPADAPGYASGDGVIRFGKEMLGLLQESNLVHGRYSKSSCWITSSRGRPRSPFATAFFWRSNWRLTFPRTTNPLSGSPRISTSFCS